MLDYSHYTSKHVDTCHLKVFAAFSYFFYFFSYFFSLPFPSVIHVRFMGPIPPFLFSLGLRLRLLILISSLFFILSYDVYCLVSFRSGWEKGLLLGLSFALLLPACVIVTLLLLFASCPRCR